MNAFLSAITIFNVVGPCVLLMVALFFIVYHDENGLQNAIPPAEIPFLVLGLASFIPYYFAREQLDMEKFPMFATLLFIATVFSTTIFFIILWRVSKRQSVQKLGPSLPQDYVKNIRSMVGHSRIFLPAAACFIVQDDKILLQRRKDNQKWAAHGGILEPQEKFLAALNRELREELNITSTNTQLIGTYAGKGQYHTYPNGDQCIVILASYLVTDYRGVICPNPDEILEVKWFSLDELPPDSEIHSPDLESFHDLLVLLSRPA